MGPFKCELFSQENEIGLIHDFATKKECMHVIKKSSPFLKSTPYVVGEKTLSVSRKRTSKHVMFRENEDKIFKELGKRIGIATRMEISEKHFEHGEEMQVCTQILLPLSNIHSLCNTSDFYYRS